MNTARYVDEKEVSKITGLALPTLRNHRHLRTGIPYVKATNRAVRYSLKDVIAYMESRKIVPEDNACAA
jgi:predicted DNA-binding transcriptional regulator AlpA